MSNQQYAVQIILIAFLVSVIILSLTIIFPLVERLMK